MLNRKSQCNYTERLKLPTIFIAVYKSTKNMPDF